MSFWGEAEESATYKENPYLKFELHTEYSAKALYSMTSIDITSSNGDEAL